MEFTARYEPAHRQHLKPLISKKRMRTFLIVIAIVALLVGAAAVKVILISNQEAAYFQRLMNQPKTDDPLADVLDITSNQDPYLNGTDANVTDTIAREDTFFAAGSIAGQCVQGKFDDFDQSTTNSEGMILNAFDTNKWITYASPSSAFTAQDGKGLFLATGNIDKNQWGAVISTKQEMLGDIKVSVNLNNLPLNTDADGSGSVYRLLLWQTGNDSIGLNIYTDRNNSAYASLSRYDSATNRTFYYNSDGVELSDSSSNIQKIATLSSIKDLVLGLQRKNTKVVATITEPGGSPVVIGQDEVYNDEPFYVTTSFGVFGQNRTLVADIDSVQLEGCFIE